MTNEEIRKLIEDAKKATQGGWTIGRTDMESYRMDGIPVHFVYRPFDEERFCIPGEACVVDAQHIANTCPAKIVPLLEELLELRYRIRSLEQ